MTDPLRTLPEDDVTARRPMPRWLWPVVIGVIALVIGFGVVWWFAGGGDSDAASTTATSSTTTTAAPNVALVPFVTEPELLNLPTLAPEGFEVCASDEDVVLCNPSSATPTITVSRPDEPIWGTTSTGTAGVRWMEGSGHSVAILFDGTGIVYTSTGLNDSRLVEIVASVPIASNDSIVIPDEPLLNAPLEQAFIADLLDIPIDDVENRGQGHCGVNTDDFTFGYADNASVLGGDTQIKMMMRGAAAQWDEPASISVDRSLIEGYVPRASQWAAQWVQRGYMWRLYAVHSSAVESRARFEALVTEVETAIGDLP